MEDIQDQVACIVRGVAFLPLVEEMEPRLEEQLEQKTLHLVSMVALSDLVICTVLERELAVPRRTPEQVPMVVVMVELEYPQVAKNRLVVLVVVRVMVVLVAAQCLDQTTQVLKILAARYFA